MKLLNKKPMLLTGIAIGVYFTFNICFALLTRYDFFFKEFAPVKWFWWPIAFLFGGVIAFGLLTYHYTKIASEWAYRNNWYYRWWRDTLSYERVMGEVNRATPRQLRNMARANLGGSWPRSKFTERVNERLKELDQ